MTKQKIKSKLYYQLQSSIGLCSERKTTNQNNAQYKTPKADESYLNLTQVAGKKH